MRSMLAALVLVGFVVAGCGTTPDESASTSGTGSSGGESSSAGSSITSQNLGSGIRPGSSEDLAVNVGDRVLFGFDRFDLTPEARDTLEKQSVWLRNYPNVVATIAGHADERGTREYNLALGERRANAVKNYLLALGIEPNRVKTISYGKERPVDPRSDADAWAKNRRGVTTVGQSNVSLSN